MDNIEGIVLKACPHGCGEHSKSPSASWTKDPIQDGIEENAMSIEDRCLTYYNCIYVDL